MMWRSGSGASACSVPSDTHVGPRVGRRVGRRVEPWADEGFGALVTELRSEGLDAHQITSVGFSLTFVTVVTTSPALVTTRN